MPAMRDAGNRRRPDLRRTDGTNRRMVTGIPHHEKNSAVSLPHGRILSTCFYRSSSSEYLVFQYEIPKLYIVS